MQVVRLGPTDIVADRPFAHPQHSVQDMNALRYMVDQVCQVAAAAGARERSIHLYLPARADWWCRIIVERPRRLDRPQLLTVVGFFGQKRARIHPDMIDLANELDARLIAQIPQFQDLLGYCSLRTASENGVNLVLFASQEAKDDWFSSQDHARAVEELAPRYYASVRLVNGLLPDGVRYSDRLRATRVKYYDYDARPAWRAVRVF